MGTGRGGGAGGRTTRATGDGAPFRSPECISGSGARGSGGSVPSPTRSPECISGRGARGSSGSVPSRRAARLAARAACTDAVMALRAVSCAPRPGSSPQWMRARRQGRERTRDQHEVWSSRPSGHVLSKHALAVTARAAQSDQAGARSECYTKRETPNKEEVADKRLVYAERHGVWEGMGG